MTNECIDYRKQCAGCVVKALGRRSTEAGIIVDESITMSQAFRDGLTSDSSVAAVERLALNGAMSFRQPEMAGLVAGAMVLVATGKCER